MRVALRRSADEITDDGADVGGADEPDRTGRSDDRRPRDIDTGHDRAPTTSVPLHDRGDPRRRRSRRRSVAAVALSRRDHGGPADRPVEAVADSFMKAWVRGDGDAVAALMSPDASVDVWSADTLPALQDWYRAVGWRSDEEGCEVVSPDSVSCDYTFRNDLTHAAGTEPVAGTFLLVIDGGTVTRVSDRINTASYEDIWKAFVDWVRTNHPDDFDLMFTSDAKYPLVDPVSIGLWARYTAKFSGSGAAYIARADAICTAANERYHDLVDASPENGTVALQAAARALEGAIAELRAVPPPADVQTRFDHGYALLQQVIDAFRQMAAADPTSSPPPSADLDDLLHQIDFMGLGLTGCAFNPSR